MAALTPDEAAVARFEHGRGRSRATLRMIFGCSAGELDAALADQGPPRTGPASPGGRKAGPAISNGGADAAGCKRAPSAVKAAEDQPAQREPIAATDESGQPASEAAATAEISGNACPERLPPREPDPGGGVVVAGAFSGRRPAGEPAWTAARLAALRRLWAAGETGGAIAARLGLSRNAVVGKARRLGLDARPSPIRPGAGGETTGRHPDAADAADGASARVVRLPRFSGDHTMRGGGWPLSAGVWRPSTCQWPQGEPGSPGFVFCGAEVAPGRPYCAAHCARAYLAPGRTPGGAS